MLSELIAGQLLTRHSITSASLPTLWPRTASGQSDTVSVLSLPLPPQASQRSCASFIPLEVCNNLGIVQGSMLTQTDSLVSTSVLVLKSVILSPGTAAELPPPQKLVARLAKALDGITNPSARASVFWLVGQFAASDAKLEHGFGWEGVAAWAPDVLRRGIKSFVNEVRRCHLPPIPQLTGRSLLRPNCRSSR